MYRIASKVPTLPGAAARHSLLSQSLYDDAQERDIHWLQIKRLARETGKPFNEVRFRYENALRHIKPNSRLRAFLPIFIAKRLRRVAGR